jgi:hypothetical protein
MSSGLRGVRVPRTALLIVIAAAVAVAPAYAAKAKPTPAPVESSTYPDPTKAALQGGCLVDPWPAAPSKNSTAVAKAIFAHKFASAWTYVHPKLQKAISESKWESCQKRNPVASPGVKIRQVKIADSKPVPMSLPLLGKQKIRAVTVWILFSVSGSQQIATQYAYWVQDKGNWKMVWLPDQYSLYKSGKCDTGQTRGLY